ncbi:MAG: 30S ribosomal protein S8 [Candidatus Aenigmatarchaeota archaeon]|nr:MAG: 30S ribosomal protein S8 [Candidatus Aenigmarchaeota archaeon]
MKHDLISDIFTTIRNAEALGKKECIVPASNLAKNILKIMQKEKYIGEVSYIEDGKGGKLRIQLLGKINECGAVRPRFSAGKDEIIKFEKRFLPAADIGILILSTSQGVMTHKDAKKRSIGGVLLGYVY